MILTKTETAAKISALQFFGGDQGKNLLIIWHTAKFLNFMTKMFIENFNKTNYSFRRYQILEMYFK